MTTPSGSSAPLVSDEDLLIIQEQHAENRGDERGQCCECSDPWPCATYTVATELRAARAQLAASAALVAAARHASDCGWWDEDGYFSMPRDEAAALHDALAVQPAESEATQ